jgi:hypothetical protein
MSTTVAGNSANYPTSITIPSDGDGPGIKAADVNVAFEGLADRTAYLSYYKDRLAAFQPLNLATAQSASKSMTGACTVSFDTTGDTITRSFGSWIADGFRQGQSILVAGTASNNGTLGVIGITATVLTVSNNLTTEATVSGVSISTVPGMVGAAFDARLGRWYGFGTGNDVKYSDDLGEHWTTAAHSAVSTLPGTLISSAAVDPLTSNAVFAVVSTDVSAGARYALRSAAGSVSFSQVDVTGSAATPADSRVVWEPVSGRFVFLWIAAASASFYSTTGAAPWTSGGALPSASWNSAAAPSMAVNGLGRIVAIARSTATTWEVMTSDDGGTSWTARTDITTTLSTGTTTSLAYDSESAAWLWSVGETSGTHSSELWKSTDNGVTWTLLKSFSSVAVQGIAVDGRRVWCAMALSASFNPRLVYSTDEGTTWRIAQSNLSTTSASTGGVFYGGGRFCVVSDSTFRMTGAAGTPTDTGTVT